MNREDAETLYGIYERSLQLLGEAEPVIFGLPKNDAHKALVDAHKAVVIKILSTLRAPLVTEYPDLDTDSLDGPPDTLLDLSEQELVSQLTTEQIASIDNALLAECAPNWRKVARVVGGALQQVAERIRDVPVGYVAQRVRSLVDAGHIEAQGNLEYMRFSEIRLVESPA